MLRTRVCDLLGIEFPIIRAPVGSSTNAELVAAVSNAGGLWIRQMYDALLADEEHLPPSAFSVEHPPAYFVRLFEHAARHRPLYRQMLREERIGWFQKLLRDYVVEAASGRAHKSPSSARHLRVPLAMHAQFATGAFVALLAWWLENDMPLSPRQMAQHLLSPHGTSAVPS